mmetsp:Transcript_38967/g.68476  ORF Transcript_38967/g.68476 Transcript_38967/m.68476 type:complete len:136 (+) Transcript_38967:212-619(+)
MGQSERAKHAATKGAPNWYRMVEYVSVMEQKSNSAAMKDAPAMPGKEGCVGNMEQRKKLRFAVMQGVPILQGHGDFVSVMEQSAIFTPAAMKDAQTKSELEGSAKRMEQRRKYVALKDVPITPRKEEFVLGMELG